MKQIRFNKPFVSRNEKKFILDAIAQGDLTGDGKYSKLVTRELKILTLAESVLLTPSATHGLEMAALAIDILPGDEVIMSSFTFVSCGNAFALRGAKIIFVDIRPDTMNIDESLIESAITEKTKAILVMHYGGVACDMDTIMEIALRRKLWVIEDAAHCIDAYYKEKHLGTIGHFGVFSFHSTKNIHCGEGGALLINDASFIERLEIIREKGTNRQQMIDGKVNKYSWVDIGSSYLMSELNAAYLYGQLVALEALTQNRLEIWKQYADLLSGVQNLTLPTIPPYARHNGHIFYIKVTSKAVRAALMEFLKQRGINSVFHYVPLHSSKAGQVFGSFSGQEVFTTEHSECLLRLPLFYGFSEMTFVANSILAFYES